MEGLQCWDEVGREVFNSQTRTLRYIGSFSRSVGNWRGKVYDSRIHENCVLTGTMRASHGVTISASLTAGNGYAGYFSWIAGTLTINIFEF